MLIILSYKSTVYITKFYNFTSHRNFLTLSSAQKRIPLNTEHYFTFFNISTRPKKYLRINSNSPYSLARLQVTPTKQSAAIVVGSVLLVVQIIKPSAKVPGYQRYAERTVLAQGIPRHYTLTNEHHLYFFCKTIHLLDESESSSEILTDSHTFFALYARVRDRSAQIANSTLVGNKTLIRFLRTVKRTAGMATGIYTQAP